MPLRQVLLDTTGTQLEYDSDDRTWTRCSRRDDPQLHATVFGGNTWPVACYVVYADGTARHFRHSADAWDSARYFVTHGTHRISK